MRFRGFITKSKAQLLIDSSVLEFIESEATKATRTETGGIVVGLGSVMENTARVTRASGPGPKARRSMFFFARDTSHCQNLLDEWAVSSAGAVDYLGEWHKHHENIPSPSSRDIETCQGIADDRRYHVKQCLLLIIGKSNDRRSLRAFSVSPTRQVEEMKWTVSPEEDSEHSQKEVTRK
jgi:integrative and conjugative element protein (TIGR02256 family)